MANFLGLPQELRDQIYEEYLTITPAQGKGRLAVLLAARLIHHELAARLYESIKFEVAQNHAYKLNKLTHSGAMSPAFRNAVNEVTLTKAKPETCIDFLAAIIAAGTQLSSYKFALDIDGRTWDDFSAVVNPELKKLATTWADGLMVVASTNTKALNIHPMVTIPRAFGSYASYCFKWSVNRWLLGQALAIYSRKIQNLHESGELDVEQLMCVNLTAVEYNGTGTRMLDPVGDCVLSNVKIHNVVTTDREEAIYGHWNPYIGWVAHDIKSLAKCQRCAAIRQGKDGIEYDWDDDVNDQEGDAANDQEGGEAENEDENDAVET